MLHISVLTCLSYLSNDTSVHCHMHLLLTPLPQQTLLSARGLYASGTLSTSVVPPCTHKPGCGCSPQQRAEGAAGLPGALTGQELCGLRLLHLLLLPAGTPSPVSHSQVVLCPCGRLSHRHRPALQLGRDHHLSFAGPGAFWGPSQPCQAAFCADCSPWQHGCCAGAFLM